jgi:multiple sugar transport system permease protein
MSEHLTTLAESVLKVVFGRTRFSRKEAMWGYLFMAPWMVGFLLLTIGPFVVSAVMSFYDWKGFGEARFVGLHNFEWMLTKDRLFIKALLVTSRYVAMSVPLGMVLTFAIAWILSKNLLGVEVLRSMYYLPSVITGVAVAFMWMYVLDPQNGPLNMLLQSAFGLKQPIPWLSSPKWTLPSFVLMRMWAIGGSMIIVLAGLKGIPISLYEAAIIDGANGWQRLWRITIPLVSPSLFYVLVMLTINSFQIITAPLVIFLEKGGSAIGPMNSALFYIVYLYRMAFFEFRMGYASALAWVLFIIVMCLSLINFLVIGRRVYYEE